MSTRLALILTAVWTLLVFAGCGGAMFVISKAPYYQRDERASKAGSGIGTVAAIGYGAVWIPWAIAYGKKRRERLEQQKRREEEHDEEQRPRKKKRP